MNSIEQYNKYFNQDYLNKQIKSYIEANGLIGYDEDCANYIQYGIYSKLYTLIDSLILISRDRQFLKGIPIPVPPRKVARVIPHVVREDEEIEKDPFDLLLVTNFKSKVKKLEEWSKQKERERCKIILERVKQEETRGKSRRGREKVMKYKHIRIKDMKH